MALLTIAIPSLNGNILIPGVLKSISKSVEKSNASQVHVKVFDNGSDFPLSEDILVPLLERGITARLIRFSSNLGYDKNILRIIEYIETEFVWLLGDDDTLLLDNLDSILDLFVENQRKVSAIVLKAHHGLESQQVSSLELRKFTSASEFLSTVFVEVSLISTLILKTSLIGKVPKSLIGLDWIHVAILLEICRKNVDHMFIHAPTPCIQVGVVQDRWAVHFGDGTLTALKHLILLFFYRDLFSLNFTRKFYDSRKIGRRALFWGLFGLGSHEYKMYLACLRYEIFFLTSKIKRMLR